jgi:hypothetical protein
VELGSHFLSVANRGNVQLRSRRGKRSKRNYAKCVLSRILQLRCEQEHRAFMIYAAAQSSCMPVCCALSSGPSSAFAPVPPNSPQYE